MQKEIVIKGQYILNKNQDKFEAEDRTWGMDGTVYFERNSDSEDIEIDFELKVIQLDAPSLFLQIADDEVSLYMNSEYVDSTDLPDFSYDDFKNPEDPCGEFLQTTFVDYLKEIISEII